MYKIHLMPKFSFSQLLPKDTRRTYTGERVLLFVARIKYCFYQKAEKQAQKELNKKVPKLKTTLLKRDRSAPLLRQI